MSLHTEINFENDICEHLAAHGWLYEKGDATKYDRTRALFPEDVLAWVRETNPKAWDSLERNHGKRTGEELLDRLRDWLDRRGTIEVLRQGIEILGARGKIKLAEFKPAFSINEEILGRYRANRLRVVRQVRYSQVGELCIDLVLFLNGIPVATAELKTDFTQSIDDAIEQYCVDRLPRPKGQPAEPLLAFSSGALVHFAVSSSEVHISTKLDGPSTDFLPFNKGDHGGKGNPLNPKGHRTAYLWEEIWERESWLEILGRYIVAQRDEKKAIAKILFPRYHQLDVTRKLQSAVLADGVGGRYLVQHSAGSGKTNSIAWTAHFFSELHDAGDRKVFDTVIVVSDRNVIDGQLQRAIEAFQRQIGVVAAITSEESSKSEALAEALSDTKKIVVCTIQTFPHALKKVRELAATGQKRFAVIADEAHSSQAGESAARLKAVLTAEEIRELEDGGGISAEDLLASQMAARSEDGVGAKAITFVAFTATPKNKTLELFGTRPDPTRKPAPDNLPRPFHVYSMRQAIEEGFILDVLQNYTTYKLAFKLAVQLAGGGQEYDERTVERAQAMKGIMGWVKLHPYNISQKVAIIVEHFRHHVAPLLGGRAKAMVVVSSRVEAVRWKLAIERYITEKGYKIGTLVAFSGEVNDPESGPDSFSETSSVLNPRLAGKRIEKAFEGEDYHILLVANKFQTGFDQPLLCGMYIDKRLAGIQAVQTLSRLNRAHPGKDTIYILDFINEAEEILAAFKTYYETAELASNTDPNLVLTLRAKLDALGFYDDNEIDRVVKVELDPRSQQKDLSSAIEPVADRLVKQYKAAQAAHRAAKDAGNDADAKKHLDTMGALIAFKADMGQFIRLYVFLSQIFNFESEAVEKRWIFYRLLLRLLDFERERDVIDLTKVKLTHYNLRNTGSQRPNLGAGESEKLEPITAAGTGTMQEKVKARLREIIERVNELFEGELTDDDKLIYVNNVLVGKLLESKELQQQAASNSWARFIESPDLENALVEAVISARAANQTMSDQALADRGVMRGLLDILVRHTDVYDRLRERAGASPPEQTRDPG